MGNVKTYYIYQLVDPRDGKPFYVGCTTNPHRRLIQHSKNPSGGSASKIEKILNSGSKPELEILDRITTETRALAENLEEAWIEKITWQHFESSGQLYKLFNKNRPHSEIHFPAWIGFEEKHETIFEYLSLDDKGRQQILDKYFVMNRGTSWGTR